MTEDGHAGTGEAVADVTSAGASVAPPAAAGDRGQAWWVFGALAVATVAVYARVLRFGVLTYDSDHYIVSNPLLKTPTLESLKQLWRLGTVESEALYIPLAYTSWWLESAIGGPAPVALMHAVNLALHVACMGGVYLLARRLSRSTVAAAVAAGVFAMHPLQVESVAWLMGRKDLLSTLFALAAMLAWLRWLDRRRAIWVLAVLLACLASWLSKPSTLVLPAILLGLGWADQRRVGRADGIFAGVLLAVGVGVYALNRMVQIDAVVALSFRQRLGAVPDMLLGWLGRLTALRTPEPYYAWPDPTRLHVGLHLLFGLLVLGLVGLVVWAWRRDWRLAVWGLVAAAIAFVPIVQVTLSYRHFLTADHYGYFPLVGLAVAMAQLAKAGRRQWQVLLLILCVFLASYSSIHLGTYSSSESFWLAATRSAPTSPHPWYGLGRTYEGEGREVAAITAYEQAVTVDPTHVDSLYNLGNLLSQGLELDRAAASYRAALAVKPNHVQAWMNLGNLELRRGHLEAAEEAYLRATEYDSPYRPGAFMNLATARVRSRRPDDAIAAYRDCIAAFPQFAPAYAGLSALQAALGDADGAWATQRAAMAAGVGLPAPVPPRSPPLSP